MNSLWLRKQNLMPEIVKKISKVKNTEFVVLAENFLSLAVWLLMEKKKSKRKE